MTTELQLPIIDEVIAKIKQMLPLTKDEEMVYLMEVRNMTQDEAIRFIGATV